MDNKQVLDKVKKLLSLANSDNENEAKLAADRANELLTRHNLSIQDITEGREYSTVRIVGGSRRKFHHELIYSLMMEFFYVEIVQVQKRGIPGLTKDQLIAVIVGEEHNVQIAKYVFEFLDRALMSGWKNFKAKYEAQGYKGLTTHKKSYIAGFYAGVRENLEATKTKVQQEVGLVIVKDPGIKDFMDDMFGGKLEEGKSLSTDTRGGIAMDEGYEQGKETKIAAGLDSGNESSYIKEGPLKLEGNK